VAESPASVVFRSRPAGQTVVVATAANVGQLGRGRAGYQEVSAEQIVACGVTSTLRTYTQQSAPGGNTTTTKSSGAPPGRYLAQVRLTLDAKHALGLDADLTDLSQLQTVRNFANSITFPFPQCLG
jgi:hypothetical protein